MLLLYYIGNRPPTHPTHTYRWTHRHLNHVTDHVTNDVIGVSVGGLTFCFA
jgi:hypothetical protein